MHGGDVGLGLGGLALSLDVLALMPVGAAAHGGLQALFVGDGLLRLVRQVTVAVTIGALVLAARGGLLAGLGGERGLSALVVRALVRLAAGLVVGHDGPFR